MADAVREIHRRTGHRLVVFHSGETLKIPHALFRLHPLQAGEEVDVAAFVSRLRTEENRYALEAAVRMLEMRDRSEQEVYRKLTDSGFSGPAAAAAVAKLLELGYLNDAAYARQAVARLQKKYGSIRIRQELRSKGIQDSLIADSLHESDREEQVEAAARIARKTYVRLSAEPENAYRRAYAALARRGFTPDVVRAALEVVQEEVRNPSDDG
ncbi:MAG: regulatory protein RecX [Clostridiales bacterium]|nr:regulatory protein RecX [Clostridiales bacterium]